MAIFKCKMCGGQLDIQENQKVVECEYCGTQQTLPRLDNDRKANLYDRANHFRRNNEFDKAMGIYEQILTEDNTDAEAYWSLVLCRYGIEYVEDPSSHKRIPTVNRAQYTSIFDDDNYKSALQYADGSQHYIYEQEAKAINEIQKGILAISQNEEPFDVFICYKETDNNGRRTPDSVLANDLYHQLTQEGFKVFFSRITLEDKLGVAYEPYIFAAINSAKVMVVLGTRPEYFKAVWVRNEWSRYLALIKQGQKKILIPAYKDMDPYDLPEEFSHLRAQDMSKLGFMQDLIRGIKKITQLDTPKTNTTKKVVESGTKTKTEKLLKRVFMFLEDEEWDSADDYCEKVLDIDPENAMAYLGKLMAELEVGTREELKDCDESFDDDNNYQKVIRFGDKKLKEELEGYIDYINERNEQDRLEEIYQKAKKVMSSATTENAYKDAANLFEGINTYKDSSDLAKECREREEKIRNEVDMCDNLLKSYKEALKNERKAKKNIDDVNNKIVDLKMKYDKLSGLKEDWVSIEEKILSYRERKNSIIDEITNLNAEKSSPGFFSGKRKKEISEKIDVLEKEKQSLQQNIATEEAKKSNFTSLNELSNELDRIKDEIKQLSNTIEVISKTRKSETIRKELTNYKYGKEFLQEYDLLFNAKIGDSLYFGKYQQNKEGNVKDDIEWLVLDKKDGKLLVISKYGLAGKPYNTTKTDVTWETCSLREWLNEQFINNAFSKDEKDMIPIVTVTADKNPRYSTNPGNATKDQVFLLSINEANKYFNSNSDRQCKPTEYAIRQGADAFDDNGNCWYWLRSPGYYQSFAAYVVHVGNIREDGYFVDDDGHAVRPALWIDLES